MMRRERGPDPIDDSDRGTGTTPPEQGPESASVTGRPAVERPRTAFHQPAETPKDEREPLSETEALEEGGSFDAIAPPQDVNERPG
jgi:hypothetical protein